MIFDVLTLFPGYFQGPFDVSMLARGKESGRLEINTIDIRSFAEDKHRTVDDRAYGGGPGMVLKPGPVCQAIRSRRRDDSHVVLLSPQGRKLTAARCRELAKKEHIILVCGHYEGIDERVNELEVDEELSIGDYVLTSGAPAAIVVVDSVSRFVPGVIGNDDAAAQDSFENGMFDAPHYTRPPVFEGLSVPDVLLEGHHEKIETWRREQAIAKTRRVRPDLLLEGVENESTCTD